MQNESYLEKIDRINLKISSHFLEVFVYLQLYFTI